MFIAAFHAAITLLAAVPVGTVVQGAPLKDGQRLNYRCNGTSLCLVSFVVLEM